MIKVNDVKIKEPSTFDIERYNVTKSGRTANGSMVMDIIAKKVKLLCSYSVLDSAEWKKIQDQIFGTNPFFTVEWEEAGVTKTMTAYAGALKYTKYRTGSIWYWSNVSFDLIEQ